jgi:hypothetical protein
LYGHVAARRPHRQFGDRDFIMQSSLYNEIPDFAICEIPTESEPSDQHRLDPRQQTTSAKRHVAQPGSDKCQTDSTLQAHTSNESE